MYLQKTPLFFILSLLGILLLNNVDMTHDALAYTETPSKTPLTYIPNKVPIIAHSLSVGPTWDSWFFRKCIDEICAQKHTNQPSGSTHNEHLWRGIVTKIGRDGLPLTAYLIVNNVGIMVHHCGDAICSIPLGHIWAIPSNTVYDFDMEIGNDGFPVIAFTDAKVGMQLLRCNTLTCIQNSALPNLIDATGTIDGPISMEIGTDGNPIIFYSKDNGDLYVAHCGNSDCTNGNTISIPLAATGYKINHQLPIQSAIQKHSVSYPYVTFIRSHPNAEILYFIRCSNQNCSLVESHGIELLPKGHPGARFHSPAVDDEGNIGIAFYKPTPTGADLKFFKCFIQSCAHFGEIKIDEITDIVGEPTFGQLMFNEYNKPTIVYARRISKGGFIDSLNLASCKDSTCGLNTNKDTEIIRSFIVGYPVKIAKYLSITEANY